jgi:hypothetical protein
MKCAIWLNSSSRNSAPPPNPSYDIRHIAPLLNAAILGGMNTQNTVITFAVEADQTKPQRFRGIAYSGELIPAYGFYGDAAIDLSSITLPSGKLFALVAQEPWGLLQCYPLHFSHDKTVTH